MARTTDIRPDSARVYTNRRDVYPAGGKVSRARCADPKDKNDASGGPSFQE